MGSRSKANFIVCSCDLPYLTCDAVEWLISHCEPGVWAILPSTEGRVEPLFAFYDRRMYPFLRKLSQGKKYRLQSVAEYCKCKVVDIPEELRSAWKNCNTTKDISLE